MWNHLVILFICITIFIMYIIFDELNKPLQLPSEVLSLYFGDFPVMYGVYGVYLKVEVIKHYPKTRV